METFEEHYAAMRSAIVKRMPGADMELIDKAVDYANDKHKLQKRKDGSPYIIHPLAVAQIVAEMGLDQDAVLGALLPDRAMLATVWRYLASYGVEVQESPLCLCRKIVRWTGKPMSLGQLSICLDIFRDVGLLEITRLHKFITIRLTPGTEKADLTTSQTMQRLLRAKESGKENGNL